MFPDLNSTTIHFNFNFLNFRYAEKRKKNNEAAKKSRKQRKEREIGYQNENEVLKQKNQLLETQNQELIAQLKNMNIAMREMIAVSDLGHPDKQTHIGT